MPQTAYIISRADVSDFYPWHHEGLHCSNLLSYHVSGDSNELATNNPIHRSDSHRTLVSDDLESYPINTMVAVKETEVDSFVDRCSSEHHAIANDTRHEIDRMAFDNHLAYVCIEPFLFAKINCRFQ